MHDRPSYGFLITFWVYGVVCGLGFASTAVGLLRGEALPGVIWPTLVPILIGPLLILYTTSKKRQPKP
jgi:hypothetical protein